MADILHELPIKAAPEKVFRALTEHQGLAGWWLTPMAQSQAEAAPKVGSIVELPFPGVTLKLKISKLEPGRALSWSVVGSPVPEWTNTSITWDLTPTAKGTNVLLGHRNYASTGGMYPQFNTAWAWHFISLKDYLETGTGTPGGAPWFA